VTEPSALARVAQLLRDAGLDYAIIGAHGVNAWLEPRFTADIDVTARLDSTSLQRLRMVFADAGLALTAEHGARLPSGPDFIRFSSADRTVLVEIQAAKTALQTSLLSRATTTAEGIRVATPEDLVVLKLIAGRPKDRIDLLGLLALPNLDWDYVERAAREWDVVALLTALRRDGAPSA
jgi:hypothetical protein